MPHKNQTEQQFIFTCLCAWLIKDKCQMNLQLEPEEYEDPNVMIGLILEAVRLLIEPENNSETRPAGGTVKSTKNGVNFPPGRLKQGFGPEVVWTINILADRALELMYESESISRKSKIIYHNKSNLDLGRNSTATNSITIGQPFVGGGLTTRPLGSYQINDSSLLFDDKNETSMFDIGRNNNNLNNKLSENWYDQVERASQILGSAKLTDELSGKIENWRDFSQSILDSSESIDKFLANSQSLMETITNRIGRHLQVINSREKFIQTNLKVPLENFMKIWRNYSIETTRYGKLVEQVNLRTEKFENYSDKLKNFAVQIDLRKKELNDGSQLRRLESMINRLREECAEFDIKIGLLLIVNSKKQAEILSQSEVKEN